ncbi:MAG: small acid-soluble spore protein SspI [Bacilli bacterium]|nr:small acid-soluble spore protein SspI [Bacilli bacterium]MDD4282275.1 small acid-soluble spore protein SspI [Bacilli bacterium]MDD4718421.1 small acid-soluble spore protein SspI [Bacilli bacterium]
MEINIRKSIIENFKNAGSGEIKSSIVSSIDTNEEITLPGLGVFFEILWKNSDENSQEFILNTLSKGLNK